MISIIIPIYNRKANLRRVLASLDKQDYKEFEVIVSDDGSTDDPVETLNEYSDRLEIKYRWQPNHGFRANLCRNEGALMAKTPNLLFLDSDVMLEPDALSHYSELIKANPDMIIVGRYDWLKPMDFSVHDVYANWEEIVSEEMPDLTAGKLNGIIGKDPRLDLFNEKPTNRYALSLYGGNFMLTKHLFMTIGMFDEKMVGHGGEDCELAIRLQKSGHKALFTQKTRGYHIYHNRNIKKNKREVLANVEYIKQKHSLDKLGIVAGNIKKGELPLKWQK